MTKTAVAGPSDEEMKRIYDELALSQAENKFWREASRLVATREEEAPFITDSLHFMKGYRMAVEDIGFNLFNKQIDLGQDIKEHELGEEIPF